VVVVLLLSLPLFLEDYLLHVMILVFLYAYVGQAWNILGGYAGQLSLGHAAYFGLGAYTSTILFMHYELSPWLGMLAGGLLAAAVGLFTGYLCFRFGLRGPFFALATLAFAEILRLVSLHMTVTGGAQGLLVPLMGTSLAKMQFTERWPYYYISLAMMIASIVIVRQIEVTRVGYYLKALHKNEDAAEAVGVYTRSYKLLAAGLSAFLTALGGTFYAQYVMYISPDTTFGPLTSIEILLRPMVGGMGTVLGPVVGSVILTPLGEITRAVIGEGKTGVHLIIYGAILIGVCLFMQRGVLPWFKRLFQH
jgi:branched-chain amino acid transport system permease protein